ncbi:MAG: HU family DNA-binding protein [Bacteroidales bacterium]|nr:HU family DNA-binding protein [Bacteroidales bacterium]
MISHVAENAALTRSQAASATESVFEAIAEALVKGDSVFIRKFGTFRYKTKKACKARDIAKGITIDVPEQHTAKLILSKELRKRLNP